MSEIKVLFWSPTRSRWERLGGDAKDAYYATDPFIRHSAKLTAKGTAVLTPPTGGGNPRDSLVSGTYKPSATTTGHVGTLSIYNPNNGGLITFSTADQTFVNQDFMGDVKVNAPGLRFLNCRFRGSLTWPTGQTGVVDCRSTATLSRVVTADPWRGVPYLEDCTIYAARPTNLRDGLMGNFHAKRCNIYYVNDGAGIYNTSTSQGAYAKLEACWIHDLRYWSPDSNTSGALVASSHTDGTHNDCVQIQSGGYIHIIGNYLHGRAAVGDDRAYPNTYTAGTYPAPDGTLASNITGKSTLFTATNGDGTGHTNGGGIIVQRNTGVALSETVVVEKNWMANGLTGGNLKDGVYVFRDNILRRGSFYRYTSSTTSDYPIRPTSATTAEKIIGLFGTNRYEDNNEILTVANGGIRY